MPTATIIAGPNGAGKTTFARQLVRQPDWAEAKFHNADEIARMLPADLTDAQRALQAGREMVRNLDVSILAGADLILETTLATRRLAVQIPKWRQDGYRVELYFLCLPNADAAVSRVAKRVACGGHNIPEATIRKRFDSGLVYLEQLYMPIVDVWYIFDSIEGGFEFVHSGERYGEKD